MKALLMNRIIVFGLFILSFCLFSLKAVAFTKPAKFTLTPTGLIKKVAVLGKDDRIKLPEKYIDIASGIGILGQPGKRGWSCTAFCVAPKIIATNAHCIVKNPTAGRHLDLSKTIFVLPSFRNNPKGRKYRERVTYPEFVTPKNPALSIYAGNFKNIHSVKSQSQDWAFAKLNHSVCKNRILSFTKRPLNTLTKAAQQKRIFMIGFHGDKKMKERLYSKKCRVRSPTNRKYFLKNQRRHMARQDILLPHTCDAFKGSSGSPILLSTKEGPKVVGINLGSLRYERYQIKKNRYTGKIISRKKLRRSGRETNMAVRPRAFLDGLARFENETLLSQIGDLKEIQTHLKTLNLYKGSIDGIFGPQTRKAIARYEQKNNLAPLKLPTQELLALLKKQTQTFTKTSP